MLNKPNQHYVWQKYLEPWFKDGKIICLRNKKDIIQTNPRNIASQRYFYKINNLNYHDCQLIRKIFVDDKPEFMKNILSGWIEPIETLLMLTDSYLKWGGQKDLIEAKKELLLKNILENLHMNIENMGFNGLCEIQSGNLSFLSNGNDENEMDVDFLLYLSFQYFRTKRMKQSVKESLGGNISLFTDFDDAFNLIVLIVSTIFGYSIYNRIKSNEYFCYLIKNTTGSAFITGDQPVVNSYAIFLGETTELEIYYPLSPTTALLVTKEKNCNFEFSVEKVKEYNDLIEQQSLELIFGNEKSDLYQYKAVL